MTTAIVITRAITLSGVGGGSRRLRGMAKLITTRVEHTEHN